MADSIRASVVSSRSCRSRPGSSVHTSSAMRAPEARTAARVRGRKSPAGSPERLAIHSAPMVSSRKNDWR